MSVRRAKYAPNPEVAKLQTALDDLKKTAAAADAAEAPVPETAPPAPAFNSLTATEQSAASLGVAPEAWKPIGCAQPPCPPLHCPLSPCRFVSSLTLPLCRSHEQRALRRAHQGQRPRRPARAAD